MAPIKSGLTEVQELYKSSIDKTVEEILRQNPRSLILFRLGLGLSLVKFGKKFKFSYATISQIERGKTKGFNKNLLSKLVRLTEKLPPLEKIVENYEKISQLSNGGQSQGIKRAEQAQLTKEEKEVFLALTERGIKPEVHKTIMTRIGPINVDLSFKEENITCIVEITISQRRQKVESMDFRAIKIKETLKNVKMIAVVPKNLSHVLKKRLEDFDHVVEFDKFKEFSYRFLAPQAAV